MLTAIKQLVESGVINTETQQAINEAWESKLNEAKEVIRTELREEFAKKYEHDKAVMVESIDKLLTESLTQEIAEFVEDKKQLAEERVRMKIQMREAAKKFENFMLKQLAEELQEFRADRKKQMEATNKLDKFVISALAEEIAEFADDKQAVVEERVKFVAESRSRIKKLEEAFIARASKLVKESIQSQLQTEITQLKEDIEVARQNMFGRKIFEAFASEFTVTHLNENKEIAKLRNALAQNKKAIKEAKEEAKRKQQLVEAKERKIKELTESKVREQKIDSLVKPLKKDRASVMRDLLESVETDRLESAFNKYLPAVLNGGTGSKTKGNSVRLTESRREITGNKQTAKQQTTKQQDATVVDIQRLAGLK